MPRVNCHCHDAFSSDGRGSVDELAREAQSRGVEILCLTNHVERLLEDGVTWEFDPDEAIARLGQCRAELARARGHFPAVELLFGAELEYRREWRAGLERLVASLPFDFLLGSVHVVDGLQISGGPAVDLAFAGREEREVYELYFETVQEMVEWGCFDVVSHLDLVKRFGSRHYGPLEPARYTRHLERIFGACIERGIGIEVNASGLAADCAEPFPAAELLGLARRVGVPFITLGTDGHAPHHVDRGLQEIERLARTAGFREVAVFRARTREMAEIGRVQTRTWGAGGDPSGSCGRQVTPETAPSTLGLVGKHHETRQGSCRRETSETAVAVSVDLDGSARSRIATGIGFFDHMLETLARHALLDLEIDASSDLSVDEHHVVEDVGLALGEALGQALGERRGIRRFGSLAPMDESLAEGVVDLGGRPLLVFRARFRRERVGDLPTELVEEFFRALADRLRATVHLHVRYGRNDHHKIEALFKAFALAFRAAVERDSRRGDEIPSSKGTLTR